jgi:hypothetical protein
LKCELCNNEPAILDLDTMMYLCPVCREALVIRYGEGELIGLFFFLGLFLDLTEL